MSCTCRKCGTEFPKKSKKCPHCGRVPSFIDLLRNVSYFKSFSSTLEGNADGKGCPFRKYFIAAFVFLVTGIAVFFAFFAYSGVYDKPYEFANDNASLSEVSVKAEKKPVSSGRYSFGDTYELGKWPQESSEPEALHWKVLEEENGVVLLISNHIIACKPYHEKNENVTWETCSLRKWLNDEFYNTAFSDEEKKRIVVSDNFNSDNATYGTVGGNSTRDSVFLLTPAQITAFLPDYELRQASPTNFVSGKHYCCGYWLRSPGEFNSYAAVVNSSGLIGNFGFPVNDDDFCVRPSLRVDIR